MYTETKLKKSISLIPLEFYINMPFLNITSSDFANYSKIRNLELPIASILYLRN